MHRWLRAAEYVAVSATSRWIRQIVQRGVHYHYGPARDASTINSDLKKVSDLDITDFGKATHSLKTVDSALVHIAGERAKFGALAISLRNVDCCPAGDTSETCPHRVAMYSDADFAAETRQPVAHPDPAAGGTAMVAQANQLPQGVLACCVVGQSA